MSSSPTTIGSMSPLLPRSNTFRRTLVAGRRVAVKPNETWASEHDVAFAAE
jgi:hypothetical protein